MVIGLQTIIDRKSITGNIIMLAGGPITWDSRKQKTIAQLSTEAEYMAASRMRGN